MDTQFEIAIVLEYYKMGKQKRIGGIPGICFQNA